MKILLLKSEIKRQSSQLLQLKRFLQNDFSLNISSPTFVIHHEYENADDRPVLVHIDAYRLQGPDELESIGWQPEGGELAADAVVAIEWADRVASLLGNSTLQVDLEHVAEQTRRIKITAKGYWQSRMESLSEALTVYKEVSQQ